MFSFFSPNLSNVAKSIRELYILITCVSVHHITINQCDNINFPMKWQQNAYFDETGKEPKDFNNAYISVYSITAPLEFQIWLLVGIMNEWFRLDKKEKEKWAACARTRHSDCRQGAPMLAAFGTESQRSATCPSEHASSQDSVRASEWNFRTFFILHHVLYLPHTRLVRPPREGTACGSYHCTLSNVVVP